MMNCDLQLARACAQRQRSSQRDDPAFQTRRPGRLQPPGQVKKAGRGAGEFISSGAGFYRRKSLISLLTSHEKARFYA
jgi:hypothetical protein